MGGPAPTTHKYTSRWKELRNLANFLVGFALVTSLRGAPSHRLPLFGHQADIGFKLLPPSWMLRRALHQIAAALGVTLFQNTVLATLRYWVAEHAKR